MPQIPPIARPTLRLPGRLLAAWPHQPAVWPECEVLPGGDTAPPPFAAGPFRPARLGMREVPVVPLNQPIHDVALKMGVGGYEFWFHREPDYRQLSNA